MKKRIVLVLATLFLATSAHASGGAGAFGSWWDSKDYGALYGGGARLGFEIFSGIALEARASYLSNDLIDDNDPAMAVIPLEGAVTWTLDVSESIKPYIGAGAGYYMKDVDVEQDNFWKDAKDCVGYFALAGLDVELGPVIVFGEAKYNLIGEDDEWQWRSADVKEKYSLDGFGANIGLKVGF